MRPTAKQTRKRGASLPTCDEPWKVRWGAAPSQWQQRRLLRQKTGPRGRRRRSPGCPGAARPPRAHAPRVRHATRPSPHARAPGLKRARVLTRPDLSRTLRALAHTPRPRAARPSAEIGRRDAKPRIPPRSGARAPGKCSSGAALRGAAERGGSEPRLPLGGFGAPGRRRLPSAAPAPLSRRPGCSDAEMQVPRGRVSAMEPVETEETRRGEQSLKFCCVRGGPCWESSPGAGAAEPGRRARGGGMWRSRRTLPEAASTEPRSREPGGKKVNWARHRRWQLPAVRRRRL